MIKLSIQSRSMVSVTFDKSYKNNLQKPGQLGNFKDTIEFKLYYREIVQNQIFHFSQSGQIRKREREIISYVSCRGSLAGN